MKRSLHQRFIMWLTGTKERHMQLLDKYAEKEEFMAIRGYELRVYDRGGMGWERTQPDEFYKGKPCPFIEYLKYKGKI